MKDLASVQYAAAPLDLRGLKIVVVALNCRPELTGIGKYVGEMVDWLAARGAVVRVVTAPPYYPAWRVAAGYDAHRYRRETAPNVVIYRCPLYVPRVPSAVRRMLHLASFAVSSFPVVAWLQIWWRPRIVFVVEPPLLCAPAALLTSRLSGAKAWLHVQDFELDAAFELGLVNSTRLRGWATAAESWLMRRFDRVSTLSTRMLERLAAKGVLALRRTQFPNWVDATTIRPLEGEVPLRRELGISPERTVLLYAGNFGKKQGLELLIEVARALRDEPQLLLLLCGDGPVRGAIECLAAELTNVRLIPLQPLERLNELMSLATIHLLPQQAGAEDLVMPSKLATMLASGRPVVATAREGSEVAQVVTRVGRVVPPGDAAAFARAVLDLVADEPLRRHCGEAARELAIAMWDRDAVLGRAFGAESIAKL